MEANTLRLGNYVTIDNPDSWSKLQDIPMVVTSISNEIEPLAQISFYKSDGAISVKNGDNNYHQFSEFISPIPLSEEWLLKLGFEEIYNSEYTHKFELTQDVSFEYRFEKFNNASGMTGLTYYGRLLGKIKHVHQLQNLFYSITGQELTIKD